MAATSGFFALERARAEFEDNKLRQAIFFGRAWRECPTCLYEETTDALHALAAQYPNATFESVLEPRVRNSNGS
jgi:hypothetical protein